MTSEQELMKIDYLICKMIKHLEVLREEVLNELEDVKTKLEDLYE